MSLKYTLTNESVTVIWNGKPFTVQKGAPNFLGLRTAILDEDWETVPKYLTVAKSLASWANGKFAFDEPSRSFFYNGEPIPSDLNERITRMATNNEDPSSLFHFWERLQKNPSYRSVRQLFAFLKHENIPITPEGYFLAYKSVRKDYRDHHTGEYLNKPGEVLEMPRNQISDDPQIPCHEGFHVGALEYALGFGCEGRRIVICKVDPEHVVCVPYDASQQKMRVCKYEVVGNYSGHPLSSTTHTEELPTWYDSSSTPATPKDASSGDKELEEIEEEEYDNDDDVSEESEGDETKEEEAEEEAEEERDEERDEEYKRLDGLGMQGLFEESLDTLRKYATHGLAIIGASKIPGGKAALISRILGIRTK